MSTAWVECWKCDECGFRWIKTEIWPERCASSKCRKRSWDGGSKATRKVSVRRVVEQKFSRMDDQARSIQDLVATPRSDPDPMATKSMAIELLAIPGVMRGSDLGTPKADTVKAAMPTPVAIAEPELPACTYTEYDTDTGETYGCRLRQHPAKIKHQRGPAL